MMTFDYADNGNGNNSTHATDYDSGSCDTHHNQTGACVIALIA